MHKKQNDVEADPMVKKKGVRLCLRPIFGLRHIKIRCRVVRRRHVSYMFLPLSTLGVLYWRVLNVPATSPGKRNTSQYMLSTYNVLVPCYFPWILGRFAIPLASLSFRPVTELSLGVPALMTFPQLQGTSPVYEITTLNFRSVDLVWISLLLFVAANMLLGI